MANMDDTSTWSIHSIEPTVSPSVNLDADYMLRICYIIIGILGSTGNLFVIVVMMYSRHLRKAVTNLLIINQSTLDLTASLLIILTTYIREDFSDTFSTSVGKDVFCRMWLTNLFLWGIFVSSTYNLVTVTFERYFAIVYPMQFNHRLTKRKAYVIIFIVWVFGPVFNAVYMIPTSGVQNGKCTVFTIWTSALVQQSIGVTVIFIQFFIPLALIIFAYIRIILVLKRSDDGVTDNRDEKIAKARTNVIKTLAVVSVCFTLCWVSNQVYYTMFNLGYDKIDFNSPFYHFTVISAFCNCCLNPIVYSVKYVLFQKAVRRLYKDLKAAICCREQVVFQRTNVYHLPSHKVQGTDSTVITLSIGSDV